jgi:prophage maintenance system killer protein
MNKLTAKQLMMINQKLTGNNLDESSKEMMEKLEKISRMPYEQDERFFYKYKNTVAKASKLGCSIASIKPFPEKNNGTAILALLSLLELNRVKMVNYENDLKKLVNYMEADDDEKVCHWIENYKASEDKM